MPKQTTEAIKARFEQFTAFRQALTDESDRGCALFAAAYIDTAIEELLRASLLEGVKIDEDLFKGIAPLASFSGRTKLAYYLGLISAELRNDLNSIRRIRNDFAHDATILSFETQSIADRCRNLGFSYHEPQARPRAHFTASATAMVALLHGGALKATRPKAMPNDRPPDDEKRKARERAAAAVKEMERVIGKSAK